MSESSKRHSKFLTLIFILKCLSKASVINHYYKGYRTQYGPLRDTGMYYEPIGDGLP